jgi:hypothetical protein
LGHPAICRYGRMRQRDENAASWLHTQTTAEIYGIAARGAMVRINQKKSDLRIFAQRSAQACQAILLLRVS